MVVLVLGVTSRFVQLVFTGRFFLRLVVRLVVLIGIVLVSVDAVGIVAFV